MPKIYRTRKESEIFLIQEFLEVLGCKISNLKWQERPDAILTLKKGKGIKRVAIEHTEYFNDTLTGQPSPLTAIAEFWRIVQASLVRRISHRKHLTGILGTATFKGNLPKSSIPSNDPGVAIKLAEELVAFARNHPVEKSEHLSFGSREFDKYPTLSALLDWLRLSRWTHDEVYASRCSWTCFNITTGNIGINLNYVKSAVKNKNKKAMNYTWGKAREKWLLIAASGVTVSNSAGPSHQVVNWDAHKLCQNSPFDRIVFWERSNRWYKWLKPDLPIVQLKESAGANL